MIEAPPSPPPAPGTTRVTDDGHMGIAAYRLLTGRHPADADIRSDDDFDRHVLASILAVSAMDGEQGADGVGLPEHDLAALLARHFDLIQIKDFDWLLRSNCIRNEDDEVAMLRDLLLAQRSTDGDIGRWLALMIARRAMEPNHLWEDLGLRDRGELSRLLMRHFAPLASRTSSDRSRSFVTRPAKRLRPPCVVRGRPTTTEVGPPRQRAASAGPSPRCERRPAPRRLGELGFRSSTACGSELRRHARSRSRSVRPPTARSVPSEKAPSRFVP